MFSDKNGERKFGLQNNSFDNILKPSIPSSDPNSEQLSGPVNHHGDRHNVAMDITVIDKKDKEISSKQPDKINTHRTHNSVLEDFSTPVDPDLGFLGDSSDSTGFKGLQKVIGKSKKKFKYIFENNSQERSFGIKQVQLHKITDSVGHNSKLDDKLDVKVANLKSFENDKEGNLKRDSVTSFKKQSQHTVVKGDINFEEDATKIFKCSKCLYTTSYKNIFMRHLTVHNDSRIFSCKCGITFRSKSSMEQWHRKYKISCRGNHMQQKVSFKKKLPRVKNLKHAMKSESDADTGVLKVAKKIKGSCKRQKCSKCKYRFSNRSNWLEHQHLHDNNTGFTCRICCITMKTKASLAFWHHRHGINHLERKRSKEKMGGNKKKVKSLKARENEQVSPSELDREDRDCFKTEKTGPIEVNKQDRQTGFKFDVNHNKDHAKHGKKIEKVSYPEIGLVNSDEEAKLVRLSDNLDGTVSEMCPQKLEMRKESGLGRASETLTKEGNRTESRRVSKTCDIEADCCVRNETKGMEDNRKELTELVTDKQSELCNPQSIKNRPEDGDIDSEADTEDDRGDDGLDLPVYPLIRKLSLKDGETVYSPVDNEIEIFEKEFKKKENYRKVKVLNIETDGCLEKINERECNDLDGYRNGTEKELMSFSSNNEEVSNERVDLASKVVNQSSESVNDNQSISVAFEIQIDLERGGLRSLPPEIIDQGCYNVSSNQSSTCCSQSLKAKVIVKNLNVVGNNQTRSMNYLEGGNGGFDAIGMDKVKGSKSQNSLQDIDKENKLELETEDVSNEDNLDNPRNGFAYPDVVDQDMDVFYASKLNEKSYIDRRYETFEDSLDIDVGTVSEVWGTSSMCDTGETDENNNRKGGDKDGTRYRNSEDNGDSGEKGRGDDGDDENRGGRDGDDDGQGNRDANNNEKDRNGNYFAELFPCLVCQETFNNKTELLRHLTKIHRLTNMCQICYFDEGEIRRFANPVSLRNHKVRDHPEDMVKCVCGAMLIDHKMLSSHLKKFKCNIYDTIGESNQMAKCICGKRFASQEFLYNHRSKCRKRHCQDMSFIEYMSGGQEGKKRCLRPSSAENVRNNDNTGMTLRAKVSKDNTCMSEDSDTSHGRSSKGRKCKENVVTYNERLYDKYFETAVSTGAYKQSQRKSCTYLQGTKEYERLSSSTHSWSDSNDVLDLRTKSVQDRNNNASNIAVYDIPQEANNNIPSEIWTGPGSNFYCDSKSDLNVQRKIDTRSSQVHTNAPENKKITPKKYICGYKRKQALDPRAASCVTKHKRHSENVHHIKKNGRRRRNKDLHSDGDGKCPGKKRKNYRCHNSYACQKLWRSRKQWTSVHTTSISGT